MVNISGSKKPTAKVPAKAAAKPSAKVGGKKPTKEKGTKADKKAAAFENGTEVKFVGYAEGTPAEDQDIEVGTRLVVKAIETVTPKDGGKTQTLLTVVKKEDSAAYDSDPDSVDGWQVRDDEVKKLSAKELNAKPAPEPIKVLSVGDLGKLTKGKDIVDVAKGLLEDAKKSFFYFGGAMAKVYYENTGAPEGVTWLTNREAWEEFCLENFDMKPANVRAYIDIYLTISAIPDIDVKRIAAMGWSKAAEVSKYITADNAEEILTKAEELPIVELKTTLKDEYVDADGKTPSGRTTRSSGKIAKTTFTFALMEDSAATAKYILETAKKQNGLETDEQVFEHILNEWAADHLDASKVAKAKQAGAKVASDIKKRGGNVTLPGKKKNTAKA